MKTPVLKANGEGGDKRVTRDSLNNMPFAPFKHLWNVNSTVILVRHDKNSNFRHHYAVNVNFPVVSLVVDGEEWTDQKDNPEIIDDWPLHNAGDITTKISIGACWQGMYVIVFVSGK